MFDIDPEVLVELANGRERTLVQVVERILEHPHREIVVDTPLVELEGLTEPETERFLDLISDPGALAPAKEPPVHFDYNGWNFQFTRVFDARPRATFDTYPNRFVRHFLRRFRDALMSRENPPDDAARLARRLDALVANSVLNDVRPLHHISADHNVLRKDPNYLEILRMSVALTRLMRGATPT